MYLTKEIKERIFEEHGTSKTDTVLPKVKSLCSRTESTTYLST